MYKLYFKGGKGIENPTDVNGIEIKEGSILTFDWFDHEDPIKEFRRKFSHVNNWTDNQISEVINKPTFIVKINHNGILFGEGIDDSREDMLRLYLHDFSFKYTKLIT